jgi:hypothetical protein
MSLRATQIPAPRRSRFTAVAPAGPPAEVLDAVEVAADVYDQLQAFGRRVHFDFDPDSGSGGLTIQVLDADGNLLRILSPGELLEITTGAPLA